MDKKGWAGSVLAGVGLMYFLDRERGGRRRALLKDKLSRGLNATADAAGKTGRDLRNRARGVVAQARSLAGSEPVSNDVLEARVRSKIGRVVSHPHSIVVTASGGVVTLAGPVLARDVDDLISCVSKVSGVEDVEDRLEPHDRAGDVPGLQGMGRPSGARFGLGPGDWTPTARLLAGAAGGGLAAIGAKKRGATGTALGIVGVGLVARAVTNFTLERLLGFGPGRRGIDIRKTIRVDAPVDRTFDYWAEISNFPLFLSHVREVRDIGRGRSHWKVIGPAGVPIEWDAVTTAIVPNQLLAWKTTPGQPVRHSGAVRFDEDPRGGTRIDVRMTYRPPAGALGHAVAALFGADPKKALDDDLVRFKSLLETGKTTAHGEEVVAVEVIAEPSSPGGEGSTTVAGEKTRRSPRGGKRSPDPSVPPRAET
jgi:uncharacterized membrane protein